MIKKISRKKLDILSYDACIAESTHPLIYAQSWYLDIVCPDWFCFVLEDYRAVMPVSNVPLLGIPRYLQAFFCQQLGIFHSKENKGVSAFFFKALKESYCYSLHYSFHEKSEQYIVSKTQEVPNYVLDLKSDYSYNKNTKRNLKKASKHCLNYHTDGDLAVFLDFNTKYSPFDYKNKILKRLKKLILTCQSKDKADLVYVALQGEILAIAVLLKHANRITYILGATSDKGRKMGASTYLMHSYFENNNSFQYFDFEGSRVPGIAQFYKGLAGEYTPYYILKSFS